MITWPEAVMYVGIAIAAAYAAGKFFDAIRG
jgi:hypothetical protein